MSDLVRLTLEAIDTGMDGALTREAIAMGDGVMKKDKKDDTGHKKGRQPNDTGGKPEKPKKLSESTGKKVFMQQDGIGKSKYTISFHDGKKTHKDGSPFFDISIFSDKKSLADFKKQLMKDGYKEM